MKSDDELNKEYEFRLSEFRYTLHRLNFWRRVAVTLSLLLIVLNIAVAYKGGFL